MWTKWHLQRVLAALGNKQMIHLIFAHLANVKITGLAVSVRSQDSVQYHQRWAVMVLKFVKKKIYI